MGVSLSQAVFRAWRRNYPDRSEARWGNGDKDRLHSQAPGGVSSSPTSHSSLLTNDVLDNQGWAEAASKSETK